MATTAGAIITGARAIVNDGWSDNYVNGEALCAECDGTSTHFPLANRNIGTVAAGSPADLKVYQNNTLLTEGLEYTLDTAAGLLIFSIAPAAGDSLKVYYYYVLVTDADWLNFVSDGAKFVGKTDTYANTAAVPTFDDLLIGAVEHYAAHHWAVKMSSGTSWWYQANAGDKSFNKDQVAAKFKELAAQLDESAVNLRDDVYKRHGRREVPVLKLMNVAQIKTWTPSR